MEQAKEQDSSPKGALCRGSQSPVYLSPCLEMENCIYDCCRRTNDAKAANRRISDGSASYHIITNGAELIVRFVRND